MYVIHDVTLCQVNNLEYNSMFAFCSSDYRTELGSRVDGTFGQVVIKCELASLENVLLEDLNLLLHSRLKIASIRVQLCVLEPPISSLVAW